MPGPRAHLVRYHGILGPSHEWRPFVTPRSPEAGQEEDDRDCPIEPWEGEEDERPDRGRRRKRRKDQGWATRIRRSLGLDALKCPSCGGRMKVIATIVEPGTVRRILRSMGLPCEVPSRAPPEDFPDEGY
ncbi:MAG: hypothetical protein HY293_20670 [Planctomycetes bacterium]|nr:hypothetical protein [Planctomycetota bacterium]